MDIVIKNATLTHANKLPYLKRTYQVLLVVVTHVLKSTCTLLQVRST